MDDSTLARIVVGPDEQSPTLQEDPTMTTAETAETAAPQGALTIPWGSNPPLGAPAAWGARGILDRVETPVLTPTGRPKRRNGRPVTCAGYAVGLLPNRQGAAGPAILREALARIVDAEFLPWVKAQVNDDPKSSGAWTETVRTIDRSYVSPGHVAGSYVSRGPGDYVYLSVYFRADDPGVEAAQWSGAGRGFPTPPAVGTRVKVTCNGIGPGVVVRRIVVHGYAGVVVLPGDPPEWYRKQNGPAALATVFGAEIAPLT